MFVKDIWLIVDIRTETHSFVCSSRHLIYTYPRWKILLFLLERQKASKRDVRERERETQIGEEEREGKEICEQSGQLGRLHGLYMDETIWGKGKSKRGLRRKRWREDYIICVRTPFFFFFGRKQNVIVHRGCVDWKANYQASYSSAWIFMTYVHDSMSRAHRGFDICYSVICWIPIPYTMIPNLNPFQHTNFMGTSLNSRKFNLDRHENSTRTRTIRVLVKNKKSTEWWTRRGEEL